MESHMTWILIISLYSSVASSSSSIATTSVPNFKSQASCDAAGKQTVNLVNPTYQIARYICVEQAAQ